MKAVFIFYYIEYEEDVMRILAKTKIEAYSKWEKVLGKGKTSIPRLDTSVWPGFNGALFIALEDEQKLKNLLEEIKAFAQLHHHTGISAFVLPLDRVV